MGVFRPNRRNRSLDRSYDARVGAASAQIAGERFNNLGTARPLRLLQDGISRDQYPSQAISALSRAFSDECVSQRIRLPAGESINGFNMPAGNGVQRHGAGVMKLAVNDNSTGSAIFAATSKANALQAECLFPAKLVIVVHYLSHQMLDHLLPDRAVLPASHFCDCLRDRVDHFICFIGVDFA
jgi:hypothetical protein